MELLLKVGSIDFDDEDVRKKVIDQYFTERGLVGGKTASEEIVQSPIVQELYFRDTFKEIEEPEKLGQELAHQQGAEEQTPPIEQKIMEGIRQIAELGLERNVSQTSKEVKAAYSELQNPDVIKQSEVGKED